MARSIDISIHALREESDVRNMMTEPVSLEFQSTLSVRRATSFSRISVCS